MVPSETASRWEQPPAWNGKAETWDDWEREVALWTDSFDTKHAPTLGPRLVRSLSHLPQVHDVGLSFPRVELVKNTVETLLTALRNPGLVRRMPTDVAATSMRRKVVSVGFAACGIRVNKRYSELGKALKHLDVTLGAGKLFHAGIRAILLLENSGLNGSEASAGLATQENSHEYDRFTNGLEQWPNSSCGVYC